MMACLSLGLLGPMRIQRNTHLAADFKSNKVRALLVYLVMEAGRPHARGVLAGLLWPDVPDRVALSNLRFALSNLRTAIVDRDAHPSFLIITRETVEFNTAADCKADVDSFRHYLAEARRLSSDPAAIDSLKQAASLYQGRFLEGFSADSPTFAEWALLRQEELGHEMLQALYDLVSLLEQGGDYRQALHYARRALDLEPWDEESHRQVMKLLALDGQRSAALAQYETCRRLLTSELDVEPARETTRLYELIRDGKLFAPPRIMHIAHEEPPALLVARQTELDQFDAFLDKALAGHGQVAFVTGSPGSGKTALIAEFLRRAIQTHFHLLTATGNCNAYTGVGDPYLPFLEIIQLLTGDTEAKKVDATLAHQTTRRLLTALPTVLHALTDSAPDLLDRFISARALLERANALIPAGGASLERLEKYIEARTEAQGRDEPQQVDLFEQNVHVLSAIARTHPLILVIDDLQWADSGSVGLLFHLGKRLAELRILVVGAYRPEEIAIGREKSRHPLESIINEFMRDFGKIHIALDHSEGRAFVDAFLDTEPNCLSAKFRDTLYRHTGGHPLFTVELLRGLQERGDLMKNRAGQWTEGGSLDWEKLPPRVEAVIAERIGRLPEAMKSLLSAASVDGEEFTSEVVARVCAVDVSRVIQQLSGALSKRHRLVRAQGTQQLDGQRVARYRFGHFLFQKYLYQQLDEIERPRLHQAIGEALEELWDDQADECAVQLARHFEIAGTSDKAIDYLWLAGERAVRLLSNEEAVTLYRHGLELLQFLPDSPQKMERELKLQTSIGVPLLALHGFSDPELAQAYGRAHEICQQIGSAPRLFQALRGLKGYYDLRGEIYTALDLGRQMLSISEQQGDEDLLIMANNNMGTTLQYLGDLTAYRHYLDKVIELYNFDRNHLLAFKFGYDPKVATLAQAAGLWMLGYPDQALKRVREAVRLADEIGQPFSQCFAYSFASQLHVIRREARAALIDADKAVAFSQKHRSPEWLAVGLQAKGWAIARMGRGEEGLELLLQGNDILRAIGSTHVLLVTAAWHGEVCGLAGKAEEGLSILDEMIPQSIRAGVLYTVPQRYQCRGELLRKLGKLDEAEVSFEKAIEIARQQQAKGWELRATLDLAQPLIGFIVFPMPHPQPREVYDWFTEGFDTPDLVDAKALIEELSIHDQQRLVQR